MSLVAELYSSKYSSKDMSVIMGNKDIVVRFSIL
jgi:hypothetical protein